MNNIELINGDCLVEMNNIPDKSIDSIICDLPYNTTVLKWDKLIPIDELWKQYKRIIKDGGAIVLFAQQPFTTHLISSNLEWWKYNWIWVKENGTNFMNSKHQPIKVTEDICVFSNYAAAPSSTGNYMRYNPQFLKGTPYVAKCGIKTPNAVTKLGKNNHLTISDGNRYPTNILRFNRDKQKLHPTQKPVSLVEYLVHTYTNEGELVLDNTAGSMTTAIACINANRRCICIEKDEEIFNIGKKRVDEYQRQLKLF